MDTVFKSPLCLIFSGPNLGALRCRNNLGVDVQKLRRRSTGNGSRVFRSSLLPKDFKYYLRTTGTSASEKSPENWSRIAVCSSATIRSDFNQRTPIHHKVCLSFALFRELQSEILILHQFIHPSNLALFSHTKAACQIYETSLVCVVLKINNLDQIATERILPTLKRSKSESWHNNFFYVFWLKLEFVITKMKRVYWIPNFAQPT